MGDFHNGGLWGKSLSDQAEISFLVIKKASTHTMQVSARNDKDKKVIAKKPLTNLYEMNSRSRSTLFAIV